MTRVSEGTNEREDASQCLCKPSQHLRSAKNSYGRLMDFTHVVKFPALGLHMPPHMPTLGGFLKAIIAQIWKAVILGTVPWGITYH